MAKLCKLVLLQLGSAEFLETVEVCKFEARSSRNDH